MYETACGAAWGEPWPLCVVSKGLSKNVSDGKYGNVTYARSLYSTWLSITSSIAVLALAESLAGLGARSGKGFSIGGGFFDLY